MKYSMGDKIGGRYEVHRIFGGQGQSGMGVVYVCYDHRDGGVLALKTYQEGFFHDKLLVDHFKRGAVAWIQLERHPCVVRALGVLKLAGQLFLGLELYRPGRAGAQQSAPSSARRREPGDPAHLGHPVLRRHGTRPPQEDHPPSRHQARQHPDHP